MTYLDQTPSSIQKLAAFIARHAERIAALEQRGLRIPILDADPGAGDYTNLWMLNDGRLRARDASGNIREYRPHDQQFIPTLATDPVAASGIKLWFKPDGQLRGRLADGTLVKYQRMRIIPTVSAVPAASSDINIWVNTAGSLGVRLANDTVVTFAPDSAGSSGAGSDPNSGDTGAPPPTSSVPKPVQPKVFTHQVTYGANEAKCYCPVHGQESQLYYGRWNSTHGERRLMFGFDDAAIRSGMTTAARMLKVELRVTNLHSYANSGITIDWGGHNFGTLPGTFGQHYRSVWAGHWPKVGGNTWRTIPNWFGYAFRDNKLKGLTVDQPSTSVSYYGLLRNDLQLRFTYTNNTP